MSEACLCGTKVAPKLKKQEYRRRQSMLLYCPACLFAGHAGRNWAAMVRGWDEAVRERRAQLSADGKPKP